MSRRLDTEEIEDSIVIINQLEGIKKSGTDNLSKLKSILKKTLELSSSYGGMLPEQIASELIRGICSDCSQVFYVSSRIGSLKCPHCMSTSVKWAWGGLKITFVPESQDEEWSKK